MWRVARDRRFWYVIGVGALGLLAWKFLPNLLYLLVPTAGLTAVAKARKARAARDIQDIDAQIDRNEEVTHRIAPESVDIATRKVREKAVQDADYWTPLELD